MSQNAGSFAIPTISITLAEICALERKGWMSTGSLVRQRNNNKLVEKKMFQKFQK
jgi:hypothetical protein